MRRGHFFLLMLAVAVGWICAPSASAQVGRASRARTGSAGSPSARVGSLGGSYTRQRTVTGVGTSAPLAAGLQGGAPIVPPVNSNVLGRSYSPISMYMGSTRRFGMIPSPGHQNLLRQGTLSEDRINYMTGFLSSTSPKTPLYGRSPRILPISQTPIYDVSPEKSQFCQYFGLVENKAVASQREPVRYESLIDALEEHTQAELRVTIGKAQRLFREATGELSSTGGIFPDDERIVRLKKAIRLFSNIRKIKPDADMVMLLNVHAQLERFRETELWQIEAAIHTLTEIARRHPEFFSQQPDIASYFGDIESETGRSEWLERQMRYYMRGSSQAVNAETAVLEAYCAWVLKDHNRARSALDKAEDLLKSGESQNSHTDKLVAALRYAL